MSKITSALEAIANTIIGYVSAVTFQLVVFPIFGVQSTLEQNMKIGLVMACVSFIRAYTIRRLFNQKAKR